MDAKAIHNTSIVAMRAANGPEMVSTKVLTRNGEFCACLPGHHAQNAGLHGEVKNRDSYDGDKNSARNIFFWLTEFAAEVADVVVTPVGVGGTDHGCAQPGEEKMRKVKRAGRKRKCEARH